MDEGLGPGASDPVLVLAPLWRRPHHVGKQRVGRFLRWLGGAGRSVVLVRAGEREEVRRTEWGEEIVIRDSLRQHRERFSDRHPRWQKKEYPLPIRLAADLLLNPDPGIIWARRVIRNPLVLAAARNAAWIMSSSPPESVHVAAMHLALKSRARLFIDMRDGWLDEPLRINLHRSVLRQWREKRLERRVLEAADRITVTSPSWQDLLIDRYPHLAEKVSVLYNCYPGGDGGPGIFSPASDRIVLIHAGQFTGSKFNNRPELLLTPIIEAADEQLAKKLTVVLRGRFIMKDLQAIGYWQERYRQRGARLEMYPPVPSSELADMLSNAHGLLLLSATQASILAKLFDYLPSRRPILAVTPEGSSVWKIASSVPQMFPVDFRRPEEANSKVKEFLRACQAVEIETAVPEEFMEYRQEGIFNRILSGTSGTAEGFGPASRSIS